MIARKNLNRTVVIKSISKEEFMNILSDCKDAIILGDDEDIREYWIIGGLVKSAVVLLKIDHCHLGPKVYLLKDDIIGIGANDRFYIIRNRDEINEISLFFVFCEIIYFDDTKIVIWDETGFICVDYDGKRLWEKGTDLLLKCEIVNNVIVYETFDGERGEIPF